MKSKGRDNLLTLVQEHFPNAEFEIDQGRLYCNKCKSYCGHYNIMEEHINNSYGMSLQDVFDMIQIIIDEHPEYNK